MLCHGTTLADSLVYRQLLPQPAPEAKAERDPYRGYTD